MSSLARTELTSKSRLAQRDAALCWVLSSATIYAFVSDAKQARRYFVSGIVQGVGFRYFTQHAAQKLGVSGYTRNMPDGRVEVYAIGSAEQLAKLRGALERGPIGASVGEVAEEQADTDAGYGHAFVVTY